MSAGFFVTGTDTGVGKTLVSAALLHIWGQAGRRVVGMKPVASGCHRTASGLRNADAEMLAVAGTVEADYSSINPFAFEPAIAPHLAAQDAGIRIELQRVLDEFEVLKRTAELIVVEGVGGWAVPLGRVITTEHMAKALDLPIIMVVGMRLGCLNHALLTARAIEAAGLQLAGWIANSIDPEMKRVNDNLHTLEQRLSAPRLGHVPWLAAPGFDQVSQYLSTPPGNRQV